MDDAVVQPQKVPDERHLVIVDLETVHVPAADTFGIAPYTYEVITYKYTRSADRTLVAARLASASVVVTTTCRIDANTIGEAPYLKLVISKAAGTDHVDLGECRQRGIRVMNCPDATAEAVSEHAIALYFAARRRLIPLYHTLVDCGGPGPSQPGHRPSEWAQHGSVSHALRDSRGMPPPSLAREVAGIVGYGAIGKRIAQMCLALGMKVQVAERSTNGTTAASESNGIPAAPPLPAPSNNTPPTLLSHLTLDAPPRTPLCALLSTSTIVFLSLPLLPSTANLLGAAELALCPPSAVVVNVGRGGVVDEAALAEAVRSGRIYGAATDVYGVEPAGREGVDSPLLELGAEGGSDQGGEGEVARKGASNLALTPHLAWFADQTILNVVARVKENVEAWARGNGGYVIV